MEDFKIGQKLNKSNRTSGAIWCNENGCVINPDTWIIEAIPEPTVEEMQAEVRAVRNQYLETYVDPKQLVMVWDSLSADDKKLYADYRQYLLDYTEVEGWYLQNPKTLDEWKQSVEEITPVDSENNELGEENIIEEIGEDKDREDLTSE